MQHPQMMRPQRNVSLREHFPRAGFDHLTASVEEVELLITHFRKITTNTAKRGHMVIDMQQ